MIRDSTTFVLEVLKISVTVFNEGISFRIETGIRIPYRELSKKFISLFNLGLNQVNTINKN